MTIRRMLFWTHLGLGLALSLVLIFLAITGLMLAVQDPVTWVAEHSIVMPSRDSPCLPFSKLVHNARNESKSMGNGVTLFADARTPALFTVSNDTVYLLNSCNGALLDSKPSRTRAFFYRVKNLHRWVAFGGERHEGLRSVKDAVNLLFPIMLVTGLILWLPRSWKYAHVRAVTLPRIGVRGRARDWNWHNVAGIWAALPLLVISLTGTIMAYGWATNLLYRAAGSPPPRAAEEHTEIKTALDIGYIDALIPVAVAQDVHWKAMTVRLPQETDKSVNFTIDDQLDNRPSVHNLLSLSRKGKVVRWEPFARLPRGRQWRLNARFLHSGDLWGIPGRLVSAFAALALLLLAITGIALSVRRLAWRQRTARYQQTKAPQNVF